MADSSKRPESRASLRDVAKAAGVSKTTAGYALQNHPEVNKATRQRILRIAARLGYAPDARVASWMATVRKAREKDLLPLVWLNTNLDPEAFRKYKFLSPYLEGCRERAFQLGYRIEEVWACHPAVPMERVARSLYQRGIEGVILTHYVSHFRLKWDHLAAVCLEGSLRAPRLHRVMTDFTFNLNLALKMLKRFGYRRIGLCLEVGIDRQTDHAIHDTIHRFLEENPKTHRVPPLFYMWKGGPKREQECKAEAISWMKAWRPDVVLGHSNHLVEWVKEAGFRVPRDMGVVHLATDDDVRDWAGICSYRHTTGAAAAELVISLIRNRQFGVPKVAMKTLIPGSWSPGRTLLVPKPG
jgi:LacI family transcriptional regulator